MPQMLKTIFVIFLVVSLIGCENQESTEKQPKIKETVTFLHYFIGSLSGGLTEMAEVFNN